MSIRKQQAGDIFRKCENCGYDRGFHLSLKKEDEGHRVILICPECGTMYDVGWRRPIK